VSLLIVAVQLLFTYAPFMQAVFQTRALSLSSWAVIGALACALFLVIELEKALLRWFGVRRM
jgi:hypothetical protein